MCVVGTCVDHWLWISLFSFVSPCSASCRETMNLSCGGQTASVKQAAASGNIRLPLARLSPLITARLER